MRFINECWTAPLARTATFGFLVLICIQNVYCEITGQIDKQFNTYSFIEPKLIHARHKREIQSTKTNPNGLEHVHDITLNFVDKGKEYLIDLSLNRELIPVNYFEKHQKNGVHVVNKPNSNEIELCNYNGKVRGSLGSWAAISTCDGIRGMFFDGNSFHYIENVKQDSGSKYHILYRHSDLNTNHTCGFPSTPLEFVSKEPKRTKRSVSSLKGPYNQNDKSRFIELILVVDQEEYNSFNNDLTKVYKHAQDIANIINSLFIPLNIFITLVGVIVWTEYNEITLSPNGDTTLTNFLHYRREHLVKDHPNDNAQLLTKVQFENGIVGKALKGPICTYEFSGGVNSDHSFVRGLVATTIAHEIGHNLGMEHDTSDCDCPSERCVMAPSSGSLSPTHWSSCSMEYLALAFEHGMDYCLRNIPEKLFEGPVCGNSFVEPGEQCDCGLKETCDNSCCNPETCMLYENATCATGKCCDLNTCRLKPAGLECRSAVHECDLPEYCSGESEYCPENVFKMDGSICEKNKAFCYKGFCRTHTDQCRLLWGPTGESSSLQCYKMNSKGTQQGNCGYNRLNRTYVKCQNENVQCGMLHCKHKNERLEFGMETVSIVSHSFINNAGSLIPCRTAIVDLGLNEVDPGLTPDGAKCGENMLCVNQKCIGVDELKSKNACPNDCNGNGLCNNKGNCHCKTGYAPPYCDHPGPGGSDDSGPASSPNTFRGFITGMYVLTFGAIPLLLAVLLFAYCSKNQHSPTDWNKVNRKKLPTDAEMGKPNGTVSPSSTLLINNQNPLNLRNELLGNYKGFSIKPLVSPTSPSKLTPSRTPIRPAPCAPPATISVNDSTRKSERPQISGPVLDATTSSAVRELVAVPLKPAPPIPNVMPATTMTAVTAANTARPMSVADGGKNGNGSEGGYRTLRRITSFMKSGQKPEVEDKRHLPATARANGKFVDKELLKNIEISEPILQKEIDMPTESLPLEADRHRAVVERAQSLRTAAADAKRRRPNTVMNFGSMRSSERPTSVVVQPVASVVPTCSRPTGPPPRPPSPPTTNTTTTTNPPPSPPSFSYQVPRPRPDRHDAVDDKQQPHVENIYSVIDSDSEDSTYKVPKPLESSLLGEIVSAIQERNNDSIYTSKTADGPSSAQQQVYENYNGRGGNPSSSSSSPPPPPSSTTSSGYVRPVDLKARAVLNNRPDLVKNCDENRSLNRSPDVLDAKKPAPLAADKPSVLLPKPVVVSAGNVAAKPSPTVASSTATVGLKKKLSASETSSSKVADIQKRFERGGGLPKSKPTVGGNR